MKIRIDENIYKKLQYLFRGIVLALFFTPQEEVSIEHFLQSLNKVQPQKEIKDLKFPFYINGIVYTNDSLWTLWVNGLAITPKNAKQLKSIVLHKVSKDFIVISVKNNPQKIVLKPHQFYNHP